MAMLRALAQGETDAGRMADMAKKQLRKKIPSCNWRWGAACCRIIVGCSGK
jgi:hypothetical protein